MSLTAYQEETGAIQSVTPNKPLPVTTGAGATSSQTQGPGASDATAVGNPNLMAGLTNTGTPASSTTGQTKSIWVGAKGNAATFLTNQAGTSIVNPQPVGGDGQGIGASPGIISLSYNFLYNGSTVDRARSVQDAAGAGVGVAAVHTSPNSSAGAGIALSATSAAASSLVLKASAGNLYGITVNSGASAGYILLFNATSAPADGAVTPIWSMPIAANAGLAFSFDVPVYCSTGITAVFSTTGPFTKTASATAFISGMVK